MQLDLPFLQQKLQEAKYEPVLGIRLLELTRTMIGNIPTALIAVQLDPGKKLVPHLHEHDGEICFPLTNGIARLGDAKRNPDGSYVIQGDKIAVDWEEELSLTPGKAFDMPEGKAHWLSAPQDRAFVLLFMLPESHLGSDRKFVIPPQE